MSGISAGDEAMQFSLEGLMRNPFVFATRRPFRLAALTAAFTLLMLNRPASAGDVFWNVTGPADWNNPSDWFGGAVPSGTNDAAFVNHGTADVTANTATFEDLRFGDEAAAGGTVIQSAGTLGATGWLRMNMSGTANSTYTISGGSATFARALQDPISLPPAGVRRAARADVLAHEQ
jgi:hypothetical protein